MDLIIASRNEGKIREISEVLTVRGLDLLTHAEFPDYPEVEETGTTFEENAGLKAGALRDLYGVPALADDSGLQVDFLDGRPGVRSSRYAGPECDPDKNIELLLSELSGAPDEGRSARFVCVIALALPDGEMHFTRGECDGTILKSSRGKGGFGYDPIFLPDGFDRSMAELSLAEKNAISHRGRALEAMRVLIQDILASDE